MIFGLELFGEWYFLHGKSFDLRMLFTLSSGLLEFDGW